MTITECLHTQSRCYAVYQEDTMTEASHPHLRQMSAHSETAVQVQAGKGKGHEDIPARQVETSVSAEGLRRVYG